MRDPGLARAIEAAGTVAALARQLGITPQAIHRWQRVPPLRAGQVARITGIPVEVLRPDVFGDRAA